MEEGEFKEQSFRNLALGKGAERREKISNCLQRITRRLVKGVDFILGSPDAAVFWGKEKIELGKEKGREFIERIADSGRRAWEQSLETGRRLVERTTDAGRRLVEEVREKKEKTEAKIVDFSKNAAVWGLTKVAAPIEERLNQAYNLVTAEIPARLKETQAKLAEIQAKRQKARARLAQIRAEEQVAYLKAQINAIQESTKGYVEECNQLGDLCRKKAKRLRESATERRNKARNWGKIRSIVQRLKTR